MNSGYDSDIEMVTYIAEAEFPFFSSTVRRVLKRHYLACYVHRSISKEIIAELVETTESDILTPSSDGGRNVIDFFEGPEPEDFLDGGYYTAVEKAILAALNFIDELRDLPQESLKAKYDEVKRRATERDSVRLIDGERNAFFHQPEAYADFAYWADVAGFTPEECVALMLGRDPRIVNSKSLSEAGGFSPFAQEFKDRLRKVERAVTMGELGVPVASRALAKWALRNGPAPDAAVTEWFQSLANSAVKPPPDDDQEKVGGPRSLYKLVVGMAMRNYGFKKNYIPDDKLESFQAITDDLASVGLNIDVKTVRKYLVDGMRLLQERGDFTK
ncbi:hypothetical protein ATER59S_01691 [Aquamicrobium terrae]